MRTVHHADGTSTQVPDESRRGRCYELSAKKVLDTPGATLVHGSIQGGDNPRIDHAWVRLPGGVIWEPSTQREWADHLSWSVFANAQIACQHSRKAIRMYLADEGTYGPWSGCYG